MGRTSALAAAAAALAFATSASAAQKLVAIDTPSRFVDVKTTVFNGEPPKVLHANVLLPDGYAANKKKRWPVLYLLHGVGDAYDTWAKPANGDIVQTAKGFNGIIVMPEGGKGFYTDWFNGGKRSDPAWESYFLRELIPQVAKRFRIAPGRGNHAIAGLSMGGMGAAYLGAQRPDYFGSVATFSGFVQHQRETVKQGFGAVAGVDYEAIFGPLDGEYASGHNPTKLAANLTNTQLFVTTGNGVADPAYDSEPGAIAGGGVVEAEIYQQNEEFNAALLAAKVNFDYIPRNGVHDWPYWREYLREAIAWGVFKAGAVADPPKWTYSTIATTGRMWRLRFTFAKAPEEVATFTRDGRTLSAEGAGSVKVTDRRAGCVYVLDLPFRRSLRQRCVQDRAQS